MMDFSMPLNGIVKAQKLHKGDVIGIISPSSPWAGQLPLRFRKGIKVIHGLGYRTKVGKNAMTVSGDESCTVADRIHEGWY